MKPRTDSDVRPSTPTSTDASSRGRPRDPHELALSLTAPLPALPYLLAQERAVVERSELHRGRMERYGGWTIGLGLAATVAAMVLSAHLPGLWWTKLLSPIIAAPLGAQTRFYQNRYKDDLAERERLSQRIEQNTNGL